LTPEMEPVLDFLTRDPTRPGRWALWNKSSTTAWQQYQLPVRKPKPFSGL